MTEIYTTFAALYDAAFDWEVSGEVGSIAGLSGLSEGRVLEPMCGSGRLLRGFREEGFETIGVDTSAEMLPERQPSNRPPPRAPTAAPPQLLPRQPHRRRLRSQVQSTPRIRSRRRVVHPPRGE